MFTRIRATQHEPASWDTKILDQAEPTMGLLVGMAVSVRVYLRFPDWRRRDGLCGFREYRRSEHAIDTITKNCGGPNAP